MKPIALRVEPGACANHPMFVDLTAGGTCAWCPNRKGKRAGYRVWLLGRPLAAACRSCAHEIESIYRGALS